MIDNKNKCFYPVKVCQQITILCKKKKTVRERKHLSDMEEAWSTPQRKKKLNVLVILIYSYNDTLCTSIIMGIITSLWV